MRVFGLTGGIASGKSTVARWFLDAGVPVIDADAVAREVVAPGQPAADDIAARFPQAVGPDGRIDRKALGALVFADPAERRALEAITHPRIRDAVAAKTRALAGAGAQRLIYDAALLLEHGLDAGLDGVVLVTAPPGVQRERLMRRDGLSATEADARIAAQMPLEAKRQRATWLIDNAGELAETRRQFDAVLAQLLAR